MSSAARVSTETGMKAAAAASEKAIASLFYVLGAGMVQYIKVLAATKAHDLRSILGHTW